MPETLCKFDLIKQRFTPLPLLSPYSKYTVLVCIISIFTCVYIMLLGSYLGEGWM